MCAVDALGIPFMLHRAATVTSADPRTGGRSGSPSAPTLRPRGGRTKPSSQWRCSVGWGHWPTSAARSSTSLSPRLRP
jgi:hypothetical protein